MRYLSLLFFALVILSAGCTTTPADQKPKVLCPACGAEVDAIFHQHF